MWRPKWFMMMEGVTPSLIAAVFRASDLQVTPVLQLLTRKGVFTTPNTEQNPVSTSLGSQTHTLVSTGLDPLKCSLPGRRLGGHTMPDVPKDQFGWILFMILPDILMAPFKRHWQLVCSANGTMVPRTEGKTTSWMIQSPECQILWKRWRKKEKKTLWVLVDLSVCVCEREWVCIFMNCWDDNSSTSPASQQSFLSTVLRQPTPRQVQEEV